MYVYVLYMYLCTDIDICMFIYMYIYSYTHIWYAPYSPILCSACRPTPGRPCLLGKTSIRRHCVNTVQKNMFWRSTDRIHCKTQSVRGFQSFPHPITKKPTMKTLLKKRVCTGLEKHLVKNLDNDLTCCSVNFRIQSKFCTQNIENVEKMCLASQKPKTLEKKCFAPQSPKAWLKKQQQYALHLANMHTKITIT